MPWYLSRQLDGLQHQTEPLIGQAAQQLGAGDYAAAAELASHAASIADASGDPKAVLGVHRVAAQAQHFNGNHAIAEQLATSVLDHPIAQIPLAYNAMPVNRRVSMRIILARVAWMQGFPEKAATLARQAIELATDDSAFSLCQAFVLAGIPIALWSGDDAAALSMTGTLAEQGSRYSLGFWQSWVPAFHALLQHRAGAIADPPKLTGALQLDTFTTFSVDLLAPATILRAETGEAGWCRPEIHRAQGEWLLAHGAPGAADAAETLFLRALGEARRQEALAWELRAATSVARLWQSRGRSQNGRALLTEMLQRFTEGHNTSDLQEATALLTSTPPVGGAGRPSVIRRVQQHRRAR